MFLVLHTQKGKTTIIPIQYYSMPSGLTCDVGNDFKAQSKHCERLSEEGRGVFFLFTLITIYVMQFKMSQDYEALREREKCGLQVDYIPFSHSHSNELKSEIYLIYSFEFFIMCHEIHRIDPFSFDSFTIST